MLSRSGLPGGGSRSRSGLGCGGQNGPVAEPLLRLIEKLDHVGGHIVDREATAGIGAARRLEGGHAVLEGLEPNGLDRAAQPESRSADRAAAAARDNEVVLRMPVMDVVCCLKDCPY